MILSMLSRSWLILVYSTYDHITGIWEYILEIAQYINVISKWHVLLKDHSLIQFFFLKKTEASIMWTEFFMPDHVL